MDPEEDVIVIVIGDGDDITNTQDLNIKNEVLDEADLAEVFKTVERHGEYVELSDVKGEIKEEKDESNFNENNENQDHIVEFVLFNDSNVGDDNPGKRRSRMLLPMERVSFVQQVKEKNPELKNDPKALVQYLFEYMKSIKAPLPPPDYYRVHDVMFECVKCEQLTSTEGAAKRHYQEKHGPRFLNCLACGADFRWEPNLYKHEKRCRAPGIVSVLKARALVMGKKARQRPFIPSPETIQQTAVRQESVRFACEECPAQFKTNQGFKAHQLLHRGERPHVCPECNAAYTSKSALSRHRYKHMDVHLICDNCGREFNNKLGLISHMDTHRPEKKLRCPHEGCDRLFSQRLRLTNHIIKVHEKLPPTCACQICPKRYSRMSVLKDHMRVAHGLSIVTRNMFLRSLPFLTDEQVQQTKHVLTECPGMVKPDLNLQNDTKSSEKQTLDETTGELKNPKDKMSSSLIKKLREQYKKLAPNVAEDSSPS